MIKKAKNNTTCFRVLNLMATLAIFRLARDQNSSIKNSSRKRPTILAPYFYCNFLSEKALYSLIIFYFMNAKYLFLKNENC